MDYNTRIVQIIAAAALSAVVVISILGGTNNLGKSGTHPNTGSGQIRSGVTVIGDSTYVTGKKLYFSSPASFEVSEQNNGWNPDILEIDIADTITWTWTTFESVYQVNVSDNITLVPNNVIHSSSFSQQFLQEGTYRFRGGASLMTVFVKGYGITPEGNTALVEDDKLRAGMERGQVKGSIVGGGVLVNISNLNVNCTNFWDCQDTWGVCQKTSFYYCYDQGSGTVDKASQCLCNSGTRVIMGNMILCII